MTARHLTILLPIVLGACTAAAPARAQLPAGIQAGSRVRVWSPELPRKGLTAQLQSWSADSLGIQRPSRRSRGAPEQWTISTRSISRLDAELPRTRGEGARDFGLVGVVAGAGSGVVLGLFVTALGGRYYPRGTGEGEDGVHALYFSVPVSAAIGAVGGASIGALFPGKRWRRIVPPAR